MQVSHHEQSAIQQVFSLPSSRTHARIAQPSDVRHAKPPSTSAPSTKIQKTLVESAFTRHTYGLALFMHPLPISRYHTACSPVMAIRSYHALPPNPDTIFPTTYEGRVTSISLHSRPLRVTRCSPLHPNSIPSMDTASVPLQSTSTSTLHTTPHPQTYTTPTLTPPIRIPPLTHNPSFILLPHHPRLTACLNPPSSLQVLAPQAIHPKQEETAESLDTTHTAFSPRPQKPRKLNHPNGRSKQVKQGICNMEVGQDGDQMSTWVAGRRAAVGSDMQVRSSWVGRVE